MSFTMMLVTASASKFAPTIVPCMPTVNSCTQS